MRYFVATYIERPDGRYDESIRTIDQSLTNKINVSANVILDFKEKKVVKARLKDPIDKDWDLIRNYFHQIYPGIINDLEKTWNKKEDPANTESPSADNEST